MQHTNLNEVSITIESALESWDFDKVYSLYKENITQDSNDLKMDFCVFLHDIGKLDELLQFIKADSKNNSDRLQCPQFWDNAKLNWGGGYYPNTNTYRSRHSNIICKFSIKTKNKS